MEIYNYNTDQTLEKYYLGISVRNVLAYSEKLRWNAYYLFSGYKQMTKKEIEVIFNKDKNKHEIHRKDAKLKKHACLTSHKGLEQLSEYIITHPTNKDPQTKELIFNEVDYYQYDYMLFDYPNDNLIDSLFNLGYKINNKTL